MTKSSNNAGATANLGATAKRASFASAAVSWRQCTAAQTTLSRGIQSCRGARSVMLAAAGLLALLFAQPAQAMHISEGILLPQWAGLWFAASAPFVIWGVLAIRRRRARQSKYMPMLAMVGAAVFLISCMPIPVPLAGSCSHPCGTGLAAILVGPAASIIVATIALAFQALFMAHGGLSTLGANVFTMGVLGSLVGWSAFQIIRRLTGSILLGAFAAGLLSDWATYAGTSFILALGLHGQESVWSLFQVISLAFMPTQVPLGVLEGVLTAMAYVFVSRRRPELLLSPDAPQGAKP